MKKIISLIHRVSEIIYLILNKVNWDVITVIKICRQTYDTERCLWLLKGIFLASLVRCREITDNSVGGCITFLVTYSQMQMHGRLSPRLSSYSLFLSVPADDPEAPDIPPRVRFTFRHNDNSGRIASHWMGEPPVHLLFSRSYICA